jgi:Golgi nucleoside diphosphatase
MEETTPEPAARTCLEQNDNREYPCYVSGRGENLGPGEQGGTRTRRDLTYLSHSSCAFFFPWLGCFSTLTPPVFRSLIQPPLWRLAILSSVSLIASTLASPRSLVHRRFLGDHSRGSQRVLAMQVAGLSAIRGGGVHSFRAP